MPIGFRDIDVTHQRKVMLSIQLWKNLPESKRPEYKEWDLTKEEKLEGTPFSFLGVGGFASVLGAKNSRGENVAVRIVYSTATPEEIESSGISDEITAIQRIDQKFQSLPPIDSSKDKRGKYSIKYMSKPKIIVNQSLTHDRLNNPYVITIMESPVMLLGDLDHFEDITALNHEFLKKLAKGILKSLYTLHSNNLLHLDIKPANILISENKLKQKYKFVLTDFGLATFDKLDKITDMYVRIDKTVGTKEFQSPEVTNAKLLCSRFGGNKKLYDTAQEIKKTIEHIYNTTSEKETLDVEYYKNSSNRTKLIPRLQKDFDTVANHIKRLEPLCQALNKIGPPSDIYSFGITLLEIATKGKIGEYKGQYVGYPNPAKNITMEFKRKIGKEDLEGDDKLFFEFADALTNVKPEKRLTASQALAHKYLQK